MPLGESLTNPGAKDWEIRVHAQTNAQTSAQQSSRGASRVASFCAVSITPNRACTMPSWRSSAPKTAPRYQLRYTLLIALREFAESAKTKGFWIGIFMLPLILAISIGVSTKLAHPGAVAVLCRRRQVRRIRRADPSFHRVGAPALRAPGAGAVRSGKPARRAETRSQPCYVPGCRRRILPRPAAKTSI